GSDAQGRREKTGGARRDDQLKRAPNFVRFLSDPEPIFAPFSPIEAEPERSMGRQVSPVLSGNCKKRLEARVGIEPTYKGFADLSLTTWVPRLTDFRCEDGRPVRPPRFLI